MFLFSNPAMDMQITIFLLAISAIVSVIVYAASKNKRKALIVFSVLANVSFLVNIGSFMFLSYGLVWLQYFSLFIWPIINIIFIIWYVRNKKQ